MNIVSKIWQNLYQETYHCVLGGTHRILGTPYNPHKFISISIKRALSIESLNSCSNRQLQLMDQMLERRMRSKKKITDAELQGIYEMITEYVLPASL